MLNLYWGDLAYLAYEASLLYKLNWIFGFNFDFDWSVGSGADFGLAFRNALIRYENIFEIQDVQESDNFYPK